MKYRECIFAEAYTARQKSAIATLCVLCDVYLPGVRCVLCNVQCLSLERWHGSTRVVTGPVTRDISVMVIGLLLYTWS